MKGGKQYVFLAGPLIVDYLSNLQINHSQPKTCKQEKADLQELMVMHGNGCWSFSGVL